MCLHFAVSILLAMKDKAKGNPNLLLQIMTTCMLDPNQLQFLHFKNETTQGKNQKRKKPDRKLGSKNSELPSPEVKTLSLSLSLPGKITQPAKDHRENGAPQELERDLQLLMYGFYIPSASGRADIAKLFLQEECARRQRPARRVR